MDWGWWGDGGGEAPHWGGGGGRTMGGKLFCSHKSGKTPNCGLYPCSKNKGEIGKSIPDAREISEDPRDFTRAKDKQCWNQSFPADDKRIKWILSWLLSVKISDSPPSPLPHHHHHHHHHHHCSHRSACSGNIHKCFGSILDVFSLWVR